MQVFITSAKNYHESKLAKSFSAEEMTQLVYLTVSTNLVFDLQIWCDFEATQKGNQLKKIYSWLKTYCHNNLPSQRYEEKAKVNFPSIHRKVEFWNHNKWKLNASNLRIQPQEYVLKMWKIHNYSFFYEPRRPKRRGVRVPIFYNLRMGNWCWASFVTSERLSFELKQNVKSLHNPLTTKSMFCCYISRKNDRWYI